MEVDTQNQVTLKKTKFEFNELELTVIDSASGAAETVIKVPVLWDGTVQIGGMKDQFCLGNNLCVYLTL